VLLTRLRQIAQQNPDVASVVEHGYDAGFFEREHAGLTEGAARVLEGSIGCLQAISVQPAASGFTSFLDGIQRAGVKLYHGLVPIVLAYGAAVVRSRVDRRMRTKTATLLREREAVFFPFRLLDPAALVAAGLALDELVDTSPPPGEPLPLFPPLLQQRASEAINRWRERIEADVARTWCRSAASDQWLLLDGTLTLAPELAGHPRAVGLVRSQRTRFFDADDARVLLGLKAGQRTSVFEPMTRRWTPVHSWYLRLREPHGHDLLWGLVRVEIAARSDSAQTADRISSWLLGELSPLALPSSQWDRILYPIHDCQQFLRARAPGGRG
jgi:hypothetical protein